MSERGRQNVQWLLARTWSLARLMLADRPDVADLLLAGERVALPGDPTTGRFVVHLVMDDESGYIVADHGTRTTRDDVPDWATPADIHVVDLRDVGDAGWQRFNESAEALSSAAPSWYDELRIEETVAAVDGYRHSEELTSFGHALRLVRVTADDIEALLTEDSRVEAWAENAITRVRHEFGLLRVPINPANRALATLVVILNCPDPSRALSAALVRTVRPDLGQDDALELASQPALVQQAVAAFPVPQAEFGIMLDPLFYALELELAGSQGIQSAWESSLQLAELGRRSLERARTSSSIELFYRILTDALLHFRAADVIAEGLVSLYAFSGRQIHTFDDHRVLCEERRVTIVGSFYNAEGLGGRLEKTSFPSIQSWIADLSLMSLERAEAIVHDLALRLVFPRFVRDISLGSLFRRAGKADAALAPLMRAFELLEQDRNRNAQLPAEPNFLVLVCDELAEAHGVLGNAETASRMRDRAAAERSEAPPGGADT